MRKAQSRPAVLHVKHLTKPDARAKALHQRKAANMLIAVEHRDKLMRRFDIFGFEQRDVQRRQSRGDRGRVCPFGDHRKFEFHYFRSKILTRNRLPALRNIDPDKCRTRKRFRFVEDNCQWPAARRQERAAVQYRRDCRKRDHIIFGHRKQRLGARCRDQCAQLPHECARLALRHAFAMARLAANRRCCPPDSVDANAARAKLSDNRQPYRRIDAENDYGRQVSHTGRNCRS